MEIITIDKLVHVYSKRKEISKKVFCTLNDFLQRIIIKDQVITINLLNLACLHHDKEIIREWKEIRREIIYNNLLYSGDFYNRFREFRSLAFFLNFFPHYSFRKSEKPDFILRHDEKDIGLEITSSVLATNTELQLEKIIMHKFGNNQSAHEIKKFIEREHPNLLKIILFDVQNGSILLSPTKNLIDCQYFRKEILHKAINKTKAVQKHQPFAHYWILIDTEDAICFSEKSDAEDLQNLLQGEAKHLKNINKVFIINRLHKAIMAYEVNKQVFAYFKKSNH